MPTMPRDTAGIFGRFGADCENLGLLLNKYQPWEKIGGQWDLTFRVRERRNVVAKRGGEAKAQWLRDRRGGRMEDTPLMPSRHIDEQALKAFRRRWEAMVEAQGGKSFSLETQWRMVVGLGGPSVLETAMTLHHLYGFPIIPGSALKGLTRARALLGVAEQLQVPVLSPDDYQRQKPQTPLAQLEAFFVAADGDDRKAAWKALKSSALPKDSPLSESTIGDLRGFANKFRKIFGSRDQAGAVMFFDGVPDEPPGFSLDIMNPHYPDYYDEQGTEPPASYQDPRPVYFLTTDSGARFSFAVAPRTPADNELAQQVAGWLRIGLKTMGVGAKTVAGYGYFV